MSEPAPTYTVTPRIFEPLELTDLMTFDQGQQFLRALKAIKESGRGAVMVTVNNGHVRWFLSGRFEDFEVPEEYRK